MYQELGKYIIAQGFPELSKANIRYVIEGKNKRSFMATSSRGRRHYMFIPHTNEKLEVRVLIGIIAHEIAHVIQSSMFTY